MAERIELPQKSGGGTEAQLESMYRYLYQMAVALNHNLAEIGGAALTDGEMKVMDRILREAGEGTQPGAARDAETLKSMIIKTAAFIKTAIDEYNMKLVGTVQAEGKLGRYVRKTGLDVAVNPEGIEQKFTFEEVIQGLKEYEINAKNYIKSGLLRTVDGVPVYGVAVGKDIVTFSEDGTETYHDGNKVAEYTADGITFWQNSVMIAKYTGNRISFYYGGNEIFYIQAGKIYCVNDMTIGSGNTLTIQTGGEFRVEGENGTWTYTDGGIEYEDDTNGIFEIKDTEHENQNATVGIYYKLYGDPTTPSLIDKAGELIIKLVRKWGSDVFPMRLHFARTSNFIGQSWNNIYDESSMSIGNSSHPLVDIHTKEVYGDLTNKKLVLHAAREGTGVGASMTLKVVNDVLFLEMSNNITGPLSTSIGSESRQIDRIYTRQLNASSITGDTSLKHIALLAYGSENPYVYYTESAGIDLKVDSNNVLTMLLLNGLTNGETQIGSSDKKINRIYADDVTYTTLTQSSSRDVKHDIKDMQSPGERLDRLRPVTFVYNDDKEGRIRQGLILEETREIMPEICTETGINYMELVPMLLKEVQELRARVAALEEKAKGE